MIKSLIRSFLDCRLVGLIVKETRQTLRDKHLLFLLIFPPTIQLLLLGAALDPGMHNLKIGVVDYSHSASSRQLIADITKNGKFHCSETPADSAILDNDLRHGLIKLAVVIPADFESKLQQTHQADVQITIDGVDAYTASIAKNEITQTVRLFQPFGKELHLPIEPKITTLYNPDLKSSWYFIPGVLGAMLTLTSTLVASATLLREKEFGTLEQLLMTPYSVAEILFAKVFPIFVLLMGDALLAVIMGMVVFGVPFRGSPALFALASALYVCVGMGLGMLLATVCKTERQAHLVSFFVNIPVMQLSGSVVPYETMPSFLRQLSAIDPLRYFTTISRSLMLKGADMSSLWPNYVALAISAVILFAFSLNRFRRQLY